jgi:hypothetical protein
MSTLHFFMLSQTWARINDFCDQMCACMPFKILVYFILRPLILAITNINTFIFVMTIFIVVHIFQSSKMCCDKIGGRKEEKIQKMWVCERTSKASTTAIRWPAPFDL